MNLKGHTLLFLIIATLIGLYLALFVHAYGRILVIMANVPFLDPDNDQAFGKLHRWWYSHSIIPGLWITWAFMDILPIDLFFYPLIGFCGYTLIHLLGDLKSTQGFGSIKLWPLHRSINARLWIGINFMVFFILLTVPYFL